MQNQNAIWMTIHRGTGLFKTANVIITVILSMKLQIMHLPFEILFCIHIIFLHLYYNINCTNIYQAHKRLTNFTYKFIYFYNALLNVTGIYNLLFNNILYKLLHLLN